MTGKNLGWIAGGTGALLALGAFVYVVAGFTAGKPDRPVFSPEWGLCDDGNTCVAVEAPCGEWQAVNAKHEADAAAYYGHLITVVETTGMECVSTNLNRQTPAAYCLSGVCDLAR